MKFAVVDDEKCWRERVAETLAAYYGKELHLDEFDRGEALLAAKTQYDVVFLDIEMPGIDGFWTAEQYRLRFPKVSVIILTTHTELSRKGYQVNAFRYMDKTLLAEEMKEALDALGKLWEQEQKMAFSVLNLGEMQFALKDILFLETYGRNVRLHTREQEYLINAGMADLEKKLTAYGFFRCHKSYIVNLDAVSSFDRSDVWFGDGKRAMVSTRKYADLKTRYLMRRFESANS